jgi:hypothetical protein
MQQQGCGIIERIIGAVTEENVGALQLPCAATQSLDGGDPALCERSTRRSTGAGCRVG